jgi:hypothetical protein
VKAVVSQFSYVYFCFLDDATVVVVVAEVVMSELMMHGLNAD